MNKRQKAKVTKLLDGVECLDFEEVKELGQNLLKKNYFAFTLFKAHLLQSDVNFRKYRVVYNKELLGNSNMLKSYPKSRATYYRHREDDLRVIVINFILFVNAIFNIKGIEGRYVKFKVNRIVKNYIKNKPNVNI